MGGEWGTLGGITLPRPPPPQLRGGQGRGTPRPCSETPEESGVPPGVPPGATPPLWRSLLRGATSPPAVCRFISIFN